MILHSFEQGVHRLQAVIAAAPVGEGVGFVDEQHAALGLFDHLGGFDGRLTHVARHQAGAIHLHQMALGQHAEALVNAAHEPGHHGFARAGIAGKHHMQGQIRGGQAVPLPGLADFDPVDQAVHFVLDSIQPDIAVQLLFQIFYVFGGFLFFNFPRLFFFLFRRFRGRRGGFRLLFRSGNGGHIHRFDAPQILADQLHALFQQPLHDFILQLNDFVLAIHVLSPYPSSARMNANVRFKSCQ